MTEKKITLGVAVDGSQAQDGFQRVAQASREMAQAVKQSGEQAGKGLGGIGAGGDESAAKVERATKSIINSIQRTTAALEAGSKSGSEYFDALARQRGVDPALLRPYLEQLEAVRAAQEEAATSSDAIKTALGIVGVTALAAAGGFAAMVLSTMEAADNLNDLSKTTGITIEQLSGLQLAAQQSGGNLEDIAGSINKLSINIAKNGDKFKQLGIDAKDPLDAFKQLADVFSAVEDPQTRAALAAAALGKSWEGAAPLLSEGSKSISEMVEKGTLLSGMTTQLGEDSDKFNGAISEISAGISGKWAGATSAIVPLMKELATSLSDVSNEAAKSPTDFSPLTETFRALILLGGNVAFAFKGVGNEIGGIAAQGAALARGDLAGVLAIGEAMKKDAEQARKAFDEWEKRIVETGTKAKEVGAQIAKALTPDELKAKAAADARAAAFIKSSNEIVAAIKKEESAFKAMQIAGRSEKKTLEDIGKALSAIKFPPALKEITDALQNQAQEFSQLSDAADEYAQTLADNGELLALEISLMGDSSVARNTAIEQFKAEIALRKELRAIDRLSNPEFEKEILRGKANGNADTAKSQAALKAQQAEWVKFYDDIYNGLSDSLYRGFEAGKGFFKSFWDGVRNLFKTTVLKLAVQGVMTGVLGGVVGTANAVSAGGANQFSSAASALSAGESLWDGFAAAGTVGGGIAAGFGSVASGIGGALGSSTLASFGAGLTGTGAAGVGFGAIGASGAASSTFLAGAGTTFGGVSTGLSGAAGGAGSAAGLGASISSTLAAIPGWGWAALAAAAVAAKFGGGGERIKGEQSVSGMLGTNNISRNVPWTRDGGWFGSDTADTWRYNLADSTAIASNGRAYQDSANAGNDSTLLKTLNDTYTNLKAASADYAKALGLDASTIASRADAINFALGKTQEENAAAIQKAFGTVSDAIATSLLPNISSFAKESETAGATLARLANNYKAVDTVFGLLGKTFATTGVESLAAREEFVNLNGGLEAMQTSVAFFAENFLTDSERLAPVAQELHKKMEALGYGSVTTVEGFKNLVKGLDLTNAAQVGLSAELLKLAPAFKAVADAAGSAGDAVGSAQAAVASAKAAYNSALQSVANGLDSLAQRAKATAQAQAAVQDKISNAYFAAQDAVASAQQKIIDLNRQAADSMAGFSTTIKTFIAGLSGNVGGMSYTDLKANLQSTAKAAAGGDTTAQSQLTAIAQQFLEASKARSTNSTQYLTDEASVRNLLGGVAASIDKRIADMNLPGVVDPRQAANDELISAQKKLAEYSALAAATGSNMDRSLVTVADSMQALLVEYKKAREDNLKAQSDYAIGQQLTSGLGLPQGGDLAGFLKSLAESVAAKDALTKAQNDLSTAIVKAAQDAQVTGEDFAKSLGLTGADAVLLAKAIKDAGLSTDGYRALMSATGLSAKDLATELTKSGVAATDMALLLAKAGQDGEKFADRIKAAGISAEQFAASMSANGLDAKAIALIFDTPAKAAQDLADSLGDPATAAKTLAGTIAAASTGLESLSTALNTGTTIQDFYAVVGASGLSTKDFGDLMKTTGLSAKALIGVLGTKDEGLQSVVIASGESLKDFIEQADAAGLSIEDFNELLSRHGLTSTSFDALKKLTNSDAGLLAEYLNDAALSGNGLSLKFDTLKTATETTADLMGKLTLTNSGLGLDALQTASQSMAALLASFKLPVISAADGSTSNPGGTTPGGNGQGATTSINQKIVEGWYAKNPNAEKSPSLESVGYWVQEIAAYGFNFAKTAFANSVAAVSGTDPLDITKFATGGAFTNGIVQRPTNFAMGQMGEAGAEAIMPLVNINGRLGVQAAGANDALLLELINEVRALREAANNTARNTQSTAQTLTTVTRGGKAMQTEVFE